jgi:hypothetical protein
MFEAEVEMERRSSFLPLLLMVCLVAAIIGLGVYIVQQARHQTPLTAQQAITVVAASVRGPGSAITKFHTGLVKSTGDEKPTDPIYRLLDKAKLITLAPAPRGAMIVSLTPQGEKILSGINGVKIEDVKIDGVKIDGEKKEKDAKGALLYRVPLARREFVSIANVSMSGVNTAVAEYNWKWVPNQLGEVFDASGPLVKSFNLWDRQTLINKNGVDFYSESGKRSALNLARAGREWNIAAQ